MKLNILYKTLLISLLIINSKLFAQTPTWTITGPTLFPVKTIGQVHGIGRISQIKFHSTDANKMYACSPSGGLWYSNNKGVSWSVMGTDKYNRASASIAIDPTNDQIIYWGTGDANYYSSDQGVWKSTDGGQNFTVSNTGMGNRLVIDMIFLPTDNKTIIAATDGGIYKSTDAGATWSLKSASDQFQDICFKPGSNGQIIFATASRAYYRSLDAGNTWTKISSSAFVFGANGTRVDCPASNPSVVYVVNMGASDATEVYKSIDGGATFTATRTSYTNKLTGYDATSTGQGNYGFDIAVNPSNENELYICAHIIWRSTDGGKNWNQQQTGWWTDLHTDQHHFVFDPYVAGQLWNANDGGVFSNTSNGTGPWANKSDGLACDEIYRAAISNTKIDMAYIGTQDNGGFYYNGGTWYNDRGGDWGPEEFFDFSSDYVYDDENSTRKHLPDGNSPSLNLPFTPSNSNKSKYAFTPANTNIGYVASSGKIYRCSNLTSSSPSWTLIYTLPTGSVKDIEVDPASADVLYVINDGTGVYRSDNATSTASFTALSIPSSAYYGGFLAVIKGTSTVYAAAGNKIYRSTNKGAAWTDVTTGFPSANINGLVADRFDSAKEAVYASYSLGVYYKDNTKSSWVSYSQGLPIISDITDLMIYNDAQKQGVLRVAYYGRGMWETPLVSSYQNITVSLTNPTNGYTSTAPTNLTISATATATSGNITKVEFYANGILLGTSTTSPYNYSWNNVAFGNYSVYVIAYDDAGGSKTSAKSNITLNLVCSKLTGTAFGSSPAYATGSEYDKAFDGNTSTFFDYSGASNGYTGLDLGTASTINAIRFYPRDGQTGRMIGGIFQASNSANFSTGVVNLDTVTVANGSTWNEFAVTNSTKFRYVRYLSPANGYCNIAEIEICGTSNQSPTVSLTSPSNNQVFASSPNTISLTANAADTDGTISKVEFYQGTTLIGTDASSPYSFNWTNVADGAYTLTAKATDNLGAVTTSGSISIIVGNQVPAVTITSPTNNSNFTQPANITFTASASDPDGTVSKVEFYNGTTLIGTSSTSPYSFTWSSVGAGNYTITAKAYDNKNAIGTSAAILVKVGNQAPVVIVTSPANNTSYTAPASFTINAQATDIDGTISKVEFYNGTTLLGSDNTFPYTYSWNNITTGSYDITAIAYDNLNLSTTSSVNSITVGNGCSAAAWSSSATYTVGMQASYNGHIYTANWWAQGTSNAPGVVSGQWTDNGACSSGNVSPTVTITSPSNNAVVTVGGSSTITATATDSDGSIAKVDFYYGTTLLVSDVASPYTYNWNNMTAGIYQVVAVVTDDKGTAVTSAPITIIVNQLPLVSITSPNDNSTFTEPATISLTATGSDPDGTISKVEFYQGNTLIGTSNVSPYSFNWTNVAQGSFQITAKAYDNNGGISTSSIVNITVSPVTGISNNSLNNYINIYPNPSSGNFTIELNDLKNKELSYKILDINGKVIALKESLIPTIQLKENIILENIATGQYIIEIKIDNQLVRERIMIINKPKTN